MHHPSGSFMAWQVKMSELEQELAAEQVIRVDLKEYEVGSPHYERLIEAMQLAQRFQQPSSLEFNV